MGSRVIGGKEALDLLREAGFEVLRTEEALDEEGAVLIAEGMGYPVALKVSGPEHKTALGGVEVPVGGPQQLKEAFRRLRLLQPQGPLLVQEMGRGLEAFCGALRDPLFGPVVAFGLGGVFVEVLEDVVFRLLPLGPEDVEQMISDLKGARLFRGEGPLRMAPWASKELLLRVSSFVEENPWVEGMDLNPVFLSEDGFRLCDARISVRG